MHTHVHEHSDSIVDMLTHAVTHAFSETIRLVPFLILTYLLMEFIEHKMSDKAKHTIEHSGSVGPLFGALLGAFPQCGFSAAASSLYAGRVITVGTLIAVYLSTSDEMLPIFLSEQVPFSVIAKVLGLKVVIGMIAGFLLDFIVRHLPSRKGHAHHHEIGHLCEHEHCHCDEENIFKSALIHALKITVFIFAVTAALGFVIEVVGEDTLAGFITNKPIIGQFIAGLIGLIPNCAASVVVTQLYLQGALSFGGMMAGLLVGAGVGVLVLFRSNDDLKKNLQILGILYGYGVFFGILIELLGIAV